jgi:soluble lytic murein transglycosylase-like protein
MTAAALILLALLLLARRRNGGNGNGVTPGLVDEARMFLTVVSRWQGKIESVASWYGVPEGLIRAVIWQESSGNADAEHPGNHAYGLMGVSLAAAQDAGFITLSADDLWIPTLNIEAGTAYLGLMYSYFNAWDRALAAYHIGPTALQNALDAGQGLTPKGRGYWNMVRDKRDAIGRA